MGQFRSIVYRLIAATYLVLVSLSATAEGTKPALPTSLDDAINELDDAYEWTIVATESNDSISMIIVDMISQTWLTEKEVNQPKWRHWLTLYVPKNHHPSTAALFIGGGSASSERPTGLESRAAMLAMASNSLVAELNQIPNQPLVFHDDGIERYEDDLIAYAWAEFLKQPDIKWLPRIPMVKASKRAMDTVEAVYAKKYPALPHIDRFVVAGGSKRGWSAWMTAATDDRVAAVIPIVIDVLNIEKSMDHHFNSYGYWAPSIGDYIRHKTFQKETEANREVLYHLIDPYSYRDKLTMPKYVVNATGDEFFVPDSWRFYWNDLIGEKRLRYVVNTNHGLSGSDGLESIATYIELIATNQAIPKVEWSVPDTSVSRISAKTSHAPDKALLWQAKMNSRDLRIETNSPRFEAVVINADEDGVFSADLEATDTKYTAGLLEFTFDVGTTYPLKLTTGVHIPATQPVMTHRDKYDEPSITVVCSFAGELPGGKLTFEEFRQATEEFAESAAISSELQTITSEAWQAHYVNWTPQSDMRVEAIGMARHLDLIGCARTNFQLEAGPGASLPK